MANETSPTPQALDVESAANLLASMLPDEDTSDETPQTADETDESAGPDTTDEEAPEADADASDEGSEADEDGETETDEEGETAADPAPDAFTVLDNGEERTVTRDEARNGYLRHSDYTRKTQAVAEQRKALEASQAEARVEREKLIDAAKQHVAALKALVPQEPDWEQIKRDFPDRFAEVHAEWTLYQDRIKKAEADLKGAEEKKREDDAKAHDAFIKQEQGKLVEAIPELKDPTKGRALFQKIAEYAVNKAGLTPEEFGALADSRSFVVLWKAMQFDAAKAKVIPAAKTKKATTTPVLKPGTSAPAAGKTAARKAAQNARQRVKQSGNIRDGAAAILSMLD